MKNIELPDEEVYTGTVKTFEHGFGFIARDDGGADAFVHFSNINQTGYRNLIAGQKVVFNLALGPKQLFEARRVTLQDED